MQLGTLAFLASSVIAYQQNIRLSNKPYSQEALDNYNVLRFLGTSSPYVSNTGFGISKDVPDFCNVTQVNVVARHGERYPTASKGGDISKALERIRSFEGELDGDLEFLPSYEFIALDEDRYDTETNMGPYAGLKEMFDFGAYFRLRYNDLVEDESSIKLYTASEERVVQSAIKFGQGFFGENYNNGSLVIIDEDDDTLGANSLTPSTSCLSYNDSINDALVDQYPTTYLTRIVHRFNSITPKLNITQKEVEALLDYCGFDLNVAGKTAICELFTTDELLSRAYYNDLGYYYSKGPGHNLTKYIGSAYVNGVINLFKNHANIPLSINFAHDTDLFHFYSALGIFDEGELSTTSIEFDAKWKVSNLAPMGARLVFEKLNCHLEGEDEGEYVRIIVNDAVIPIHAHSKGPGFSTNLKDFESYISKRLNNLTYADVCDLKNDSVPTELSLWW